MLPAIILARIFLKNKFPKIRSRLIFIRIKSNRSVKYKFIFQNASVFGKKFIIVIIDEKIVFGYGNYGEV
jgi:hypothetical protein